MGKRGPGTKGRGTKGSSELWGNPVSLYNGMGEQKMSKWERAGTVSVFSGQTGEQTGRQKYGRVRQTLFLHKAKLPDLQAHQTEFCHLGTDVDPSRGPE